MSDARNIITDDESLSAKISIDSEIEVLQDIQFKLSAHDSLNAMQKYRLRMILHKKIEDLKLEQETKGE